MKFRGFHKITLPIILAGIIVFNSYGQIDEKLNRVRLNTITTAIPFLLITPNARSGAMGDAGVSISPDVNAIHFNASKLAFAKEKLGFAVSHTPWLKNLVPDINLSYLSFYYKVGKLQNWIG